MLFVRTPSYALFGFLPVAIALVIAVLATTAFGLSLSSIVHALAHPLEGRNVPVGVSIAIEVVLALALVTAWVTVTIMAFATVVQIVGGPFYDVLSGRVEAALGGAPPEGTKNVPRILRGMGESLCVFLLYLAIAIPLLAVGFVPFVGQTVVPAMEALIGGFFLTLEMTRNPLERRGLGLSKRLGLLWRRRAESLGFGVTLFLLCLVPGVNFVAFPGAVVGGVLLARRLSSDE